MNIWPARVALAAVFLLLAGGAACAQSVALAGLLGNNFLGRFQMNRNNDQMVLDKRF